MSLNEILKRFEALFRPGCGFVLSYGDATRANTSWQCQLSCPMVDGGIRKHITFPQHYYVMRRMDDTAEHVIGLALEFLTSGEYSLLSVGSEDFYPSYFIMDTNGKEARQLLDDLTAKSSGSIDPDLLPADMGQAKAIVDAFVREPKNIGHYLLNLTTPEFKWLWFAIAYAYPGLHPDGANTGKVKIESPGVYVDAESGWPIVLLPVQAEAARRYNSGELADWEYYPAEASHKALSDAMRTA